MLQQPTFEELKSRIEDSLRKYHGNLPGPLAIAWDGYLAALLEWGALSASEFDRLFDLLGEVDHKPVREILLGEPEP